MTDYKWKPIEPLSDRDRAIDLGDIKDLYQSWHSARERLKKASAETLQKFADKLVRSLSIETGILERLYELDRGTTEALILHGFVEDLVARSSTNIEPSLLIDILRDQEAAIKLVMDCVSRNRPLTKGVIHELHAILTKHQDTTKAVDQFGRKVDIPLRKGAYKEFPNNPTRPDGITHEYCPPIHVQSEMDNLLTWYLSSQDEDPVVLAAWLHHRFTQIHPYRDGNGRVARALITLVLLKADLLPLVLDRDLRKEYIDALEAADEGNLGTLALLFSNLEKKAILQALSVDAEAEIIHDRTVTRAVIDSLAAKFQRRRIAKDEQLRKVNDVALALRSKTRDIVRDTFHELSKTVEQIGETEDFVMQGGNDSRNEYWYKGDIIEFGRQSDKWVNFDEAHYFIKATIRTGTVRLVFVISFHHVGRELSGIMEATSFAFLEFYEGENDRVAKSEQRFQCSLDPFVITWNTDATKILPAFRKWLDSGLAVAIKEWGDRV